MGSVIRALRKFGGLPADSSININNALKEILNVKMDDSVDATAGATTTSVGFQITDFVGDPIAGVVVLNMGAFDDADLSIAAVNATLDTASQGTILGGAGTAGIKIKTDANGRFACVMTNAVDETVFTGCSPSFASPLLDCREVDSTTYSA
jgi:hypothetical protein